MMNEKYVDGPNHLLPGTRVMWRGSGPHAETHGPAQVVNGQWFDGSLRDPGGYRVYYLTGDGPASPPMAAPPTCSRWQLTALPPFANA
jgi:hypothetical protein